MYRGHGRHGLMQDARADMHMDGYGLTVFSASMSCGWRRRISVLKAMASTRPFFLLSSIAEVPSHGKALFWLQ